MIASLRAKAGTVKTVCSVALACIALASLLVDTHHAHTWAEQHKLHSDLTLFNPAPIT